MSEPVTAEPVSARAAAPTLDVLVMVSEAGVDVAPAAAVALAPESRPDRVAQPESDRADEREIDVPMRLSPAPAGA